MKRITILLCALATVAFTAGTAGAGPENNTVPAKPAAVPAKPAEPEKDAAATKPNTSKKMETITLGAGCFWCTETILQRIKGVSTVISGYSNGKLKNPTYEDVCTGESGHCEVVQVNFDPEVISLEKLLGIFFELHDPTTLNRQGADSGTQYRSGIYYRNDEQKAVAERVKAELEKSKKYPNPIVTEIVKEDNFNPAEGYHQDYFDTNYTQGKGNYRYCQGVIVPKLKKMGLLKDNEK